MFFLANFNCIQFFYYEVLNWDNDFVIFLNSITYNIYNVTVTWWSYEKFNMCTFYIKKPLCLTMQLSKFHLKITYLDCWNKSARTKLTFLYICLCFAFHRTCVLVLKYFLNSESFFLNWNNSFAIPSRTVYPFSLGR